jgi:hypothetical protein
VKVEDVSATLLQQEWPTLQGGADSLDDSRETQSKTDMNANPAINSQAYGYGGAMNQGPFIQQVPPSSQSFQPFNTPGLYPSVTPQPQGHFQPQQFPQQQQQQAGFPGSQNYGGTPQPRGMWRSSLKNCPEYQSRVLCCSAMTVVTRTEFSVLTIYSTNEPVFLPIPARLSCDHWPFSRPSIQRTYEQSTAKRRHGSAGYTSTADFAAAKTTDAEHNVSAAGADAE